MATAVKKITAKKLLKLDLKNATSGMWEVGKKIIVWAVNENDLMIQHLRERRNLFREGALMVWVIFPWEQTIEVWETERNGLILKGNDRLENFPSLPGFSCTVAELFA